jgi:hypothetical protein
MARPPIADRGHCLQIWRVAANIFNKQSRTAYSGWSSSLGFERWTSNPHPKLEVCYETLHTALDQDGFFDTHGRGEKSVKDLGGKARRKETARKTKE